MTFVDDDNNVLEFNGEFAMTKQAVSFFNGAIKGDVSINFSVENNSVNREVLGYYGPQMVNQVAFTKQAFNRVRNGNILDRGYIVIQSDQGKTLSCFYVSGNSNWVQLVQGLITELDYTGVFGSNYTTLFSATNILAQRSATSGIVFPECDWIYGLEKGSNIWAGATLYDQSITRLQSFQEYYPCFYLKSLVNEICAQNGIKITGNILDDGIYNSIVLSPVNGQLRRPDDKIVTATGSSFTITSTVSPGDTYNLFTTQTDDEDLLTVSTYTANKNTKVLLTINIIASTTTGGNTITFRINGTNASAGSERTSGASGVFASDQYQYEIAMESGQTIFIGVRKSGGTASISLGIKFDIPTVVTVGDYVEPSMFLPSVKSIDVIKYVINRWGCVASFNEYSKTININILEKINTESAYDWSEYYLNHRSEYTVTQAKNNYIKLNQPKNDSIINKYNDTNSVDYGGGNIETGNTLKYSYDILKLPFAPSSYGLSKGNMWLANIPLASFESAEWVAYSSITNGGSIGTGSDDAERYVFATNTLYFSLGEVVRVVDDLRGDLGLFYSVSATSNTQIDINNIFTVTGTGRIYKQAVSFNDTVCRELIYNPSGLNSDITTERNFYYYDGVLNLSSEETLASIAWFSKQKTGLNIDTNKANLAFDNTIGLDPTIKQRYFNKISKFLQNPNIRARMLLPESVYQSFVFDQFIYLKTETLTGYFFVDSIVNYIDSNTPVEVNLYML